MVLTEMIIFYKHIQYINQEPQYLIVMCIGVLYSYEMKTYHTKLSQYIKVGNMSRLENGISSWMCSLIQNYMSVPSILTTSSLCFLSRKVENCDTPDPLVTNV